MAFWMNDDLSITITCTCTCMCWCSIRKMQDAYNEMLSISELLPTEAMLGRTKKDTKRRKQSLKFLKFLVIRIIPIWHLRAENFPGASSLLYVTAPSLGSVFLRSRIEWRNPHYPPVRLLSYSITAYWMSPRRRVNWIINTKIDAGLFSPQWDVTPILLTSKVLFCHNYS